MEVNGSVHYPYEVYRGHPAASARTSPNLQDRRRQQPATRVRYSGRQAGRTGPLLVPICITLLSSCQVPVRVERATDNLHWTVEVVESRVKLSPACSNAASILNRVCPDLACPPGACPHSLAADPQPVIFIFFHFIFHSLLSAVVQSPAPAPRLYVYVSRYVQAARPDPPRLGFPSSTHRRRCSLSDRETLENRIASSSPRYR